MKVDELVKELRLRATHVPERQQFASHAMSHAADLLEAQAEVVDAERELRVLGDSHPRADAINRLRRALARLAELEKAK